MAALDFPNSPTLNQTYTSGTKTWEWDGTSWNVVSTNLVLIAGSNQQVQFNDNGVLGAHSGFTYNKSSSTATLGNLTLSDITAASVGTGAIVVSDSGILKTRTAAQILSEIAAEPTITAGTTSQYWRGDKTWQTLSLQSVTALGAITNQPITLTSTSGSYSVQISVDTNGNVIFNAGANQNFHFSGDVVAFSSLTPPVSTWWTSLPYATTTTVGGVKIDGTTITINGSGVISSTATGGTSLSGTGYVKMSGTTPSYVASIPNTDLTNSSITVQGTSVSLGGSVNVINGTGFVKSSGTTVSYDNNTYLTDNQSITISGDASGSGTTSIAVTLATVNSNTGTFNNLTVNAKGLVTAASNVSYLTSYTETDTLASVTARGASTSTAVTFNNAVTFAGNLLISNATSPNTYYLQFGDNTGWVYRFMTNVSGTPTTRFSFTDAGNFTAVGEISAYSDIRFKTNINTIENALDKVMSLRGVTYNRKDTQDVSQKIGVIAQEIKEILPEVVTENNEGILSVSYGNIVGVLIEAIKELKQEIKTLKQNTNLL